ncbi:ABC transporter ATP-binding protein [Leifsonia lichenia]
MIEFSDVTVSYDKQQVLGPVDGRIAAGRVTSIVGPNGAGKSTLLTVIGRLTSPDTGRVTVGGLDVHSAHPRAVARTVAILRQENHLTARLRVRELVRFGRYPHSAGRLSAADHEAVDRAIGFLGLEPYAERFIDQLSGGQRQRAFVAMVLAQETEYILLDEPLNNLDIKHAVLMMAELRRVATDLGRTVVIVVHDINFAAAWSDDIVAMRDGSIVASGTAEGMMDSELLSGLFDTPVEVHEVAGRKTAVYFRG